MKWKRRTTRGAVYFRQGKRGPAECNGKRCRWWIQYTVDGQAIRDGADALCDDYLSYANAKKDSWKSDKCYLRRIPEHLGDVPVDRISRTACEDFKQTLTEEWQKRARAKGGALEAYHYPGPGHFHGEG